MPSDPGRPPPPTPPVPPPTPPAAPPHEPSSPPHDPVSPAAGFTEPRRLHPSSVVLGINVRQLIQAFLFPAAATFAAGGRVMLTALAIVGTIGLVFRTLAWQRFTFSFDGEVLRVDEGVLSRNHRALDVARIQQVEVDRSLATRLLGLAALRVETAGSSSEAEVELRVVTKEDAVALRTAVREGKARASTPSADVVTAGADQDAAGSVPGPVLHVPLGRVVLAAVTGVRLLVFPAVILGAFQFVGQGTAEWVESVVDQALQLGLVERDGSVDLTLATGLAVAGTVLVLSVATAIVVGVLRDARFRIQRVDDDLHVSRGLLSTRDSVLPLRRIQLVRVQRNWLRRALGYTAVRIHSAGGSGDGDRRVTVPLLPDAAVDQLVAAVYPGVPGIPSLTSHPHNALRRAVVRWVRRATVPVALVWLLPFGWLEPFQTVSLTLLPVAAVLGVVEYRQLAHGTSDRVVAARQGALSVATSLAPLVKVQAVSTQANWFQRRLGLATVTAHVAGPGGDVEVLDAGTDVAAELHGRLTEHAADPVAVGPTAEPAPGD